MKILIDADACPVIHIAVEIARELDLQVLLFTDTSHHLHNDYAQVLIVDKGRDSVDFALINKTLKGDVVITQDYGLATMVLSKQAHAINQNGLEYHDGNIDRLLFERHLSQKIRKSGGRTGGPPKRTKENDIRFEERLRQLLAKALQ